MVLDTLGVFLAHLFEHVIQGLVDLCTPMHLDLRSITFSGLL